MAYDNTNRGVLFPEQEKKTDKSPDYTGKINIDGKDLRLAGWKQQSANGKVFLSLSVSEFEQKQENRGRQSDDWQAAREKFKKDDGGEPVSLDDIPF